MLDARIGQYSVLQLKTRHQTGRWGGRHFVWQSGAAFDKCACCFGWHSNHPQKNNGQPVTVCSKTCFSAFLSGMFVRVGCLREGGLHCWHAAGKLLLPERETESDSVTALASWVGNSSDVTVYWKKTQCLPSLLQLWHHSETGALSTHSTLTMRSERSVRVSESLLEGLKSSSGQGRLSQGPAFLPFKSQRRNLFYCSVLNPEGLGTIFIRYSQIFQELQGKVPASAVLDINAVLGRDWT